MMALAKDVEEGTTSAPRVNERKQSGTYYFNTKRLQTSLTLSGLKGGKLSLEIM
jgi:hypothetical protein